jgi:hypothetical protein
VTGTKGLGTRGAYNPNPLSPVSLWRRLDGTQLRKQRNMERHFPRPRGRETEPVERRSPYGARTFSIDPGDPTTMTLEQKCKYLPRRTRGRSQRIDNPYLSCMNQPSEIEDISGDVEASTIPTTEIGF